MPVRNLNIGFVSTRLAGTDGVSLETQKWVDVLEAMGHRAHYFAGKLDAPPERSLLCEKAFFEQPDIAVIQKALFGLATPRPPEITACVERITAEIKSDLETFIERFDIDLLVPENILAIPMNVPLGLAVTELIEERKLPAIAHHHDFAWERARFAKNSASDYLEAAFPPPFNHDIRHVVINSKAVHDLAHHRKVPATVIPNVFDFENPPPPPDDYAADFRSEFDIAEDEKLVLQPTRVVPRKGIEHAIKLIARLQKRGHRAVLVITHLAGDEGYEYLDSLKRLAAQTRTRLLTIGERISETRGSDKDGRKIYTLWDAYPHADFVTYPSLYEGFGNAFLEALYFRKPILVNRYEVYAADIEPLGFQAVTMDGILTNQAVDQAAALLEEPDTVARWAEHNYELCRQHFSYRVLRDKLAALINELCPSQ